MSNSSLVRDFGEASPDQQWRDLYRIGAISCIVLAVLTVLAVIAYFIWPYTPGFSSVAEIFELLQNNRLGGLISLDLSVPLVNLILTLQLLALYAALKGVKPSYALIALVFGLMSVILFLTVRPLAELVALSNQYAEATSDAAKSQYLAAGDALNALFGGTSWMLSQFLIPVFVITAISGLGATIGAVLWSILLARILYRLGWKQTVGAE